MAYTVTKSDGSVITIQNSTINDETNLNLIGQNYPGYGQAIAENFVRLAESFADDVPPGDPASRFKGDPVIGQFWYDTVNGKMNYYTGTVWNEVIDPDSNISGNAATATKWQTPVSMTITGEVTGTLGYIDGTFTTEPLDGSIDTMTFYVTSVNSLNGQPASYYLNASNINSGTIGDEYLPATISSNITGNAATASALATARTISLTGDATGSATFDGSANVSINVSVSGSGHDHALSWNSNTGVLTVGNNTVNLDGRYERNPQTLSWNGTSGVISISGGNSIDIDGRYALTSHTHSYLPLSGGTLTGSLTVQSSVTATSYNTSSDEALKECIDTVEASNIAQIKSLKLKTWKWKNLPSVPDLLRGKCDTGIIAQDIEAIPELKYCVDVDENGNKVVNYGKLAVHLILLSNEESK